MLAARASLPSFAITLGLKQIPSAAAVFFIFMTGITYILDLRIQSIFVIPSLTLALSHARAVDGELKEKITKVADEASAGS